MDSHSVGGLHRSTELLATPGAFMPCDQDNRLAGSLSKAIRERERAPHNFTVKLVGYLFFLEEIGQNLSNLSGEACSGGVHCAWAGTGNSKMEEWKLSYMPGISLQWQERGEEFSHPQTLGTTWVLILNPSLNYFCEFSLEFIWPLTIWSFF